MILTTLSHAATTLVVHAGGIINTITDQNAQLQQLVKNVAVTVVLVMFLWMVHKKSWAVGAIIGGLLVAGAVYFGINGGLQWIGTLFTQQANGG